MPQMSAAAQWPPIARFTQLEATVGIAAEARGGAALILYEFIRFGLKQGWACLFGAAMLALIMTTHFAYPPHAPLGRYDFLFIAAILIQVGMLVTRLETLDEAKVICAFHVIGTIMEVHKTAIGSWIYPEHSVFHVGGVPLFSGFMYASVGSYLARVWRLFDFRFSHHPGLVALSVLSVAIYVNFLVDHLGYDLRFALIGATAVLFARTTIYFKVWRRHRFMPMLVGLVLVAAFIWIGENLGTFTGTWLYPRQLVHWKMVPVSKLTSWFLLMIVSYTLVAWVNGITACPSEEETAAEMSAPGHSSGSL